MDFEKARRDYSGQGTCRTGSKLCEDSLISTCVCLLLISLLRLHLVLCLFSFQAVEEHEKEDYLERELWKKDNYEASALILFTNIPFAF